MKINFRSLSPESVVERTDQMKPFSGKKGCVEMSKKVVEMMVPFLDMKKVNREHRVGKKTRIGSLPAKINHLMRAAVDPIQNWSFGEDKDGSYLMIRCMHGVYAQQTYLMPLYWLPLMAKRNKKLHNIIINVLQYLKYRTEVTMLDDDWGGWPYEVVNESIIYVKDGSDPEKMQDLIIAEKEYQLELFDKHFEKYIKLINKAPVRPDLLMKRIKRFPTTVEFEKWILEWCLDLMDIASGHDMSFEDLWQNGFALFCDENNIDPESDHFECNPISMRDWVMFCWFDDSDHSYMVEQHLESAAGECGVVELYEEYRCRTSEDISNGIKKFYDINGSMPERMAQAIKQGSSKMDLMKHYLKGNLLASMLDEPYRRSKVHTA